MTTTPPELHALIHAHVARQPKVRHLNACGRCCENLHPHHIATPRTTCAITGCTIRQCSDETTYQSGRCDRRQAGPLCRRQECCSALGQPAASSAVQTHTLASKPRAFGALFNSTLPPFRSAGGSINNAGESGWNARQSTKHREAVDVWKIVQHRHWVDAACLQSHCTCAPPTRG